MAEVASGPALTALPTVFPLDFGDGGRRLRCVKLSEGDYRAASFLDERVLAGRAPILVPIEESERLAARLTGESDFIFHIGHAGSTLVSRLLGASERIFALREPAVLRTFSYRLWRGHVVDTDLAMTMRLLARVWRPGQRSLVKATSFAADLAPGMLAASPSAKAILMFVRPQVAIATRLAGPATRAELASLTPTWLERLRRRLGTDVGRLDGLSEGEQAALGWACEMCALARAARVFPARTRWLEFEHFLDDPARGLAAALGFLYGEEKPGEAAAMVASGELGRYAKAREHDFDTVARRAVIGRGLQEHGAEVERGLTWLNAAAVAHQGIAAAVRSSALRSDWL